MKTLQYTWSICDSRMCSTEYPKIQILTLRTTHWVRASPCILAAANLLYHCMLPDATVEALPFYAWVALFDKTKELGHCKRPRVLGRHDAQPTQQCLHAMESARAPKATNYMARGCHLSDQSKLSNLKGFRHLALILAPGFIHSVAEESSARDSTVKGHCIRI